MSELPALSGEDVWTGECDDVLRGESSMCDSIDDLGEYSGEGLLRSTGNADGGVSLLKCDRRGGGLIYGLESDALLMAAENEWEWEEMGG